MVQKVLNKHKITYKRWDTLVAKIESESAHSTDTDLSNSKSKLKSKNRDDPPLMGDSSMSQLKVCEKSLQQAWTPSRRVSKVATKNILI